MLSSLRPVCFFHKGTQKTANRKITPFEAHMQEKMQFTAYLQGFVNTQEDGKLEKIGAKSHRPEVI